ncbi:DUF4365 domain-containing protein [Nocardiopsis rhodophaea]|uniref:DUF4365 domain-containing protein n=1 Tax=Nocardiopsis rhodophaea TaxID=280238 RepID=UPI0031DA20C7
MELDHSGVDLIVGLLGSAGGWDFPEIRVQVKSWSQPVGSDSHWHYNGLTEKQFNMLAGDNFRVPRFLFVVTVPSDPELYTEAGHDCLRLAHAGYWISLVGHERFEEPSSRRRTKLEIPKENLLTASVLRELVAVDIPGQRKAEAL